MTPYKRLFALGAGVLAGIMLVLLSWSEPQTEEVSPLTFQQVLDVFGESSNLTNLERDEWLENLEGKQVHWDGWVSSAQDSVLDTIKVVLWSQPVSLTDGELDVPKGAHFAILSFHSSHRLPLSKLKIGRRIKVGCIFQGHVGATTVSLEECNIEGVRYDSHPDDQPA